VINTYTSYQLITRDIDKSLTRIQTQPVVGRETKYFLENITKVTSIDDFVNNDRLFKYAMKAFGLEDMSYAKAFMKKALKEGVTDPDSFANKLSDKRYAEFVSAFNFAEYGSEATVYNKAQQLAVSNFKLQAQMKGVDPDSQQVKDATDYYLANIVNVKSIDDLMADDKLFAYAATAFGMDADVDTKDFLRKILEGGVRDPDSLANKQSDSKYAAFASAYNFEAYGEDATTRNPAQIPTTEKYYRQTLEEDAGQQNEGVRLALYFQRKAPGLTTFYQILADKALAAVVRTALGLPDSFAQADIDKQVQYFQQKLKIEDFSDPKALEKFLTRFTTMWEIDNPSSPALTSLSVLFSQPTSYGVSTDLMMAIQKMRS